MDRKKVMCNDNWQSKEKSDLLKRAKPMMGNSEALLLFLAEI